MSKLLPFQYFGSKVNSFDFINPKIPRTRQYIEPFGGSATVLLNREPVPTETYNDLYGDVPHFFEVLRDRPEDLIDALRKTPYSREEYEKAIDARDAGYPDCSDLERARLFFTTLQQSRSMRQFGDKSNWTYNVWGAGRPSSGNDGSTGTYKYKVEDVLGDVAGRLTDVQIENRPAIDVIETHDRETATFYVDPPYPHSARGSGDNYAIEMTDDDHRDLAETLRSCEGYVALSGYNCELYDELYGGWYRYEAEVKSDGESKNDSQEILWTNYNVDELGGVKIGKWGHPSRKGRQLTLTGAVGRTTSDYPLSSN